MIMIETPTRRTTLICQFLCYLFTYSSVAAARLQQYISFKFDYGMSVHFPVNVIIRPLIDNL